jgi:hypothetical protein
MSVSSPRLAAAQRTAADKRPARRWARIASWLVIVPTLALFSFSIVANAMSYGKPDYVGTAKELGTTKPLVLLKTGQKVMCSVTASQAAAISARYSTWWTSMAVDGKSVPVLAVSGAKENDIASMVGPANCKLVREKSIFYLPFNANLS